MNVPNFVMSSVAWSVGYTEHSITLVDSVHYFSLYKLYGVG
jgi:hypothetical protein